MIKLFGEAHIETWYRCPVCHAAFDSYKEAMDCRNNHPIRSERWAVGPRGKAVRIFDNHAPDSRFGENAALREASLSDFIEERKQQLAEMERKKHEQHED